MKIPTSQPESAPFRASFLLQVSPPYRETLERLGQLLAVFARGLEPDAVPDLPAGMAMPDLAAEMVAPDVPAEMAAVLADLRHAAATLTWIGQHLTASELSPADLPVAEGAAHAAEWLNRLIEALESGAGEPGRVRQISVGPPDRFSFDSVRARVGLSIPLPLRLARQVGWKAGREVEWTLSAEGLALHPVEGAVEGADGPES